MKRWIWVPCPRELFKPAYIVRETATHVTAQSNVLETLENARVFKMNPQKFDRVEDLAFLSHLNEPSVLHNLKTRYDESLIYTYSGLFLISLNPYRPASIYSDEVKKSVMMKKPRESQPHIFSVANEAYRCMLSNRENQSILITGESGAGKTENTKRVIEFLAYAANGVAGGRTSIDTLLICANPILEAFGNAKTVKNDNSSRFGKFIQLKFKGGTICGARIEKYLLEKSRVIRQSQEERSYHIFYYLLKGASPSLRSSLCITGDPGDYKCLRNSCFEIRGVDDKEEFERLSQYFERLGITDTLKYYKTIAAILHLSNVEFVESNDKVLIQNQGDAETACSLLNISVTDFIKEVVYPSIRAGTEVVTHYRTREQCIKVVEGLMKLLYESLFDSLVFDINSILDRSHSDCFIGVLDIAGFEIFDRNSFEQLCINYTNEKLQQFFNHHMFILEQEIYKSECIDWDFVDFGLDLEPTIATIESSNPIGILSYLDEECVMPCATDETLLNKLKTIRSVEKHPFKPSFKLKHYAGHVEYEVKDWLDKNKDVHSESLHNLVSFQCGSRPSNTLLKKGIFRTVSQSHRENLKRLMDLLKATQPHFVRCILPNLNKSSSEFDKKLVLDQLRCNGVLEGIRISRLGYPGRLSFSEFNDRYSIFSKDTCESGTLIPRKQTEKILSDMHESGSSINGSSDYRLGNTMVFFRQGVLADIENLRDKRVADLAKTVQSLIRKRLAVRKFNLERERAKAITLLQENARKSVDFLRWKWWSLFLRIKPLLEVKKNEEHAKEKEEQIREYVSLVEKERAEKKAAEAELSCLKNVSEELRKAAELSRVALGEKDDLLESLRRENRAMASRLDDKEKMVADLQAKVEQCIIKEDNHNHRIDELTESIRNLSRDLQTKEDTIASLTKKDGNLNTVLKAREEEIKTLKESLAAELVRLDASSNTSKELSAQLADARSENASLTKALSALEEKLRSHENYIYKLREEIEEVQYENESLQNEIRKRGIAEQEVAKQTVNLKQELEYHKMRSSALDNTSSALREQVQDLESALEEYSRIKDGSQETVGSLERQVKVLKQKLANEEGLNKVLMSDKEELYNENLRLMQSRLDDLFKTETEFNRAKKALQHEIQKLESENARLKMDLYNSTSSDGSDDVAFERVNKLLENEKGLRKQLDIKVIELENTNAKNENLVREMSLKLEQLEAQNRLLESESRLSSLAGSDLKRIKDDLDRLQTALNSMADTFQGKYFDVLRSRNETICGYIAKIEELSKRIAGLESEVDALRCHEESNVIIRKELDSLVKANSMLKGELDSAVVNNECSLLHIDELKSHISRLEADFNRRESELSEVCERYNKRASGMQEKEQELSKSLLVLRDLIDKNRRGPNGDLGVEAVSKAFIGKIDALNDEILELNKRLGTKELEVARLSSLLDDALVLSSGAASGECLGDSPERVEVVEKQNIVSTFVVDKDSFKASERKSLINCGCKYMERVKILEVPRENREESIRLSNEINLLRLKLKQTERALQEQSELVETMRECMSVLRRRK